MRNGLQASRALPEKVRADEVTPGPTKAQLLDRVFFGIGTLSALSFGLSMLGRSFDLDPLGVAAFIAFWAAMAYIALPRIHRILTTIYVPNYFIGRTRTSDGLLGDPLNLAVRGNADQLMSAMTRAGWILADPVNARSSLKIITTTLGRRSYAEAPVSPLFLFDKTQDFAFQQEVDGNPAKRHHVRFWSCPQGWLLPGGHQVDWLGSGTYDRAVGLSFFTLQVTHRIDADIDVERDYLVSTLSTALPQMKVDVLRDFTTGYHCRNGGGDAVRTDGDLPVLDLRDVPVSTPAARPEPPRHPPAQIWASAALLVLYAVSAVLVGFDLSSWQPVSDSGESTSLGWLFWAGTAVTGFSVLGLLALIGPMWRRSDTARLTILVMTLLCTFTPLGMYLAATPPGFGWADALFSQLPALILVMLTSPTARAWTTHATAEPAVP